MKEENLQAVLKDALDGKLDEERNISASSSNELLCGIRKEFAENAEHFDSLMVKMLAKNDRLLVLATKHCPQEHRDFDEILKLADT